MAGPSSRSMIDEKAFQSLKNNAQPFISLLGEPQKEENGFAFPINDLPFVRFNIRYEIDKKFLGKIYVMILEGGFKKGKWDRVSERIELFYSGFIRKGNPFFASVPSRNRWKGGNGVLQRLNGDQGLRDACQGLEIEFLKIFLDPREPLGKVQVRPYGGAWIKILFPPFNYQVVLVEEQAGLIYSVMKRIAELIAHWG